MASQLKDEAWLAWIAKLMGTASERTLVPSHSPQRFCCLLDDLPLHLIPQWFYRSEPFLVNGDQLLFNPDCFICAPGQLPSQIPPGTDLLRGFSLDETIAWVHNRTTGALLPFWLGPRLEAVVSSLKPGQPLLQTLSPEDRLLLAAAGILQHRNRERQRAQECRSVLRSAARAFRKNGYVPIRALLHPFHVAALRRYYRHLVRRGQLPLEDNSTSRRYVVHNESVARFFHYQLMSTICAIAGEPIKPSYVYAASYLGGANLRKHTDREQCEFSVTLCLDFCPEPALATSWPVCLETAEETASIYQALGDGLVYRGTRVPHYRDRLGEGDTSTSIFFHYVSEDFDGPLC